MHRRSHFPQQLSEGKQQRVSVARVLVNDSKLIRIDKPTSNLDSKIGMELFSELNNQGFTIIMETHSEHDSKSSNRVIRVLDSEKVMENKLANY